MECYTEGLFRGLGSSGVRSLFPLTDESLEAIMAGLEPNSDDCVLSVAGCGDQAFALLEKAGKVIVCDINEAQLRLVRERKEGLQREDYEAFVVPTGTDFEFNGVLYRLKYFREGDRLDTIRKRLSNLEIVSGKGIDDFVGERTFTKIYASNAIGELYTKYPNLETYMARVAQALQENGLLYVSNGAEIDNLVPDISRLKLQLVPTLTDQAKKAEKLWTPKVYRKVS